MNQLRRPLIAMLLCAACSRTAPKSERVIEAASSSPTATVNKPSTEDAAVVEASDESDMLFRDPPDSSTYSWTFPSIDHGNERFIGQAVRHPSGLLVIWFDTATRATEDTPAGTTHVDSIVVSGLQPGEYLTPYCNAAGRRETWKSQIVGILRDTANYLRPRSAWMLDTLANKIRAIPTEPVLCSAADLFGDGE